MSRLGIFRNYFITSVRSARREKTFALLNVLGLSIGFAACLYIGIYCLQELRHDTFHAKADRIYRITQTFIWSKTDKLFDSTGPAVMSAISNEVPEFEAMTRIHPADDALATSVADGVTKVFEEKKILYADSTFFQVFTFPLISGNSETALVYPNSIVVSQSMAEKYFGTTDVLGKQLAIGEPGEATIYQVTAVAENPPPNSYVDFNFVISMSSVERLKLGGDSWWWTTFVNFGVLRQDANVEEVARKVSQVPGKYLGAFLMKYKGISYEEFLASGESWNLYIQPLLDIHLRSANVFSRLNQVGDINNLYILAFVAALILFLSVINFVNLTTARSTHRAKEVGIRKVLGSQRNELMLQFVMESELYCLTALATGVVFVFFLTPYLNDLYSMEVSLAALTEPLVLTTTLGATFLIGLFAGLYPAFYLSSFRPVQVLKGKLTFNSGRSSVRNVLITLQFAVSISLIVCALVVHQQVNHWMGMDLGFDRENKLVIQNVDRLKSSATSFQNEVESLSQVQSTSISSDTPPYIFDSSEGFYLEGNEEVTANIAYLLADENFVPIYDLKLIAGRNFSPEMNDRHNVLVSRSIVKSFGLADPSEALNRELVYNDHKARIVGVFENIATEVNWEQLPVAVYMEGGNETVYPTRYLTISFQNDLKGEELTDFISQVESKWLALNPNYFLKYTFSDQEYEQVFASTISFGQQMTLFSFLAIFIAVLGLTGLVSYVIERRSKEISIRKILGASVISILKLLSGEFVKMLALGFTVASVVSWFIMSNWLEDFANRAPITAFPFLVAGTLMLTVALSTLCLQAIKTAVSNPVDSLRNE